MKTELTKQNALTRFQAEGFNAELTEYGLKVWGENWEANFTDAGQDSDWFTGEVPSRVHELAIWDDAATRQEYEEPVCVWFVDRNDRKDIVRTAFESEEEAQKVATDLHDPAMPFTYTVRKS